MPHAALWVVQRTTRNGYQGCHFRFNAARGFVGGATKHIVKRDGTYQEVSMPHAALWVVKQGRKIDPTFYPVSMPHAALLVVQQC